jgi:NAD(P)-dependent dehydrogenase (short-subunit alcohol dehydrogenase family)
VATDKGSVVLTGATGRIGSVLAGGFAALGWNVAMVFRDAARARVLQQRCGERGAGNIVLIEADLAAAGSIAAIVDGLSKAGFQPTSLVNNARDIAHLARQEDGSISRSAFEGELRLGVIVPYELTSALAAAPGSTLRSVVNISSIYGMVPPQLHLYDRPADAPPESYGAAKAALLHLTKELAVRLAPRVRVNAISYGGVAGRASDAYVKRYENATPMRAMLGDDDLFGAVKFLSSEDARAITGHNLVVDGGWTTW